MAQLNIKIMQLVILFAILISPISYLCIYEKSQLQIVSSSHQVQLRSLQSRAQALRQKTQKESQQLTIDLLNGQSHRNYAQEELIKLSLRNKVKSNYWNLALSTYKHIHIFNILVLETHTQTIQSVRQQITRALQWFNQNYRMNFTIVQWNSTKPINLDKLERNTIVLNIEKFQYENIQENIASRLKKGEYHDQYYQKQIIQQLRNTNLFYHCRYTHQQCMVTTFLLLNPFPKTNKYLNIENNLFIFDEIDKDTLFNSIAQYLQVLELQKIRSKSSVDISEQLSQVYLLLKKQAYLTQVVNLLEYIDFTHSVWVEDLPKQLAKKWSKSPQSAYQYLLDGKHISPYIHDPEQLQNIQVLLKSIQQFLQKGYFVQQTDVNLLTDTTTGKIDLFPNNFKAGVYLPLLILFIYPLLIKLKDLITFSVNFSSIYSKKSEKKS